MAALCFNPFQFASFRPLSTNVTSNENPRTRRSKKAALRPFVVAASLSESRVVSPRKSSEEDLPVYPPDSLTYPPGYLGAVPDGVVEPGETPMEYLINIISSRVYNVAVQTQLQLATKLSERLNVKFWIKREDTQPVFSFKLRGAYNMISKLPEEQLAKGVITASAGNHAQGVALAARDLGRHALIIMPTSTPEIKIEAVKKLGGEVERVGETYDDAQAYAKQKAEEEGLTYIPAFDHPDIIAGQGTVGMEIVQQMEKPLHAIFVPVGGGGLISGIAAYAKSIFPKVKVIGVEPTDSNSMAMALHHGQRVELASVGTFADGVAVKAVGVETFRLCRQLIDGVVLVDTDAICAAIKDMFEETRSILEPSGALAIAGAAAYCKYYGLENEGVIAVASGANMNFDTLAFVVEHANVGSGREAVLATFMPEEPGSLKKFCELLGPMQITEFKYRYDADRDKALVLYSVGYRTAPEFKDMAQRMESSQLRTVNLTSNRLAKDHFRYLMGGRSDVKDELLCQFVVPERPGALTDFLDAFSPRWNISLVCYRARGEISANVLVGLQVPEAERGDFHESANRLGFDYAMETPNDAFQLLMR